MWSPEHDAIDQSILGQFRSPTIIFDCVPLVYSVKQLIILLRYWSATPSLWGISECREVQLCSLCTGKQNNVNLYTQYWEFTTASAEKTFNDPHTSSVLSAEWVNSRNLINAWLIHVYSWTNNVVSSSRLQHTALYQSAYRMNSPQRSVCRLQADHFNTDAIHTASFARSRVYSQTR